jgi:hypothetical protein
MRHLLLLAALPLAAGPLAAQSWDLRWEVPFPKGQSLPQTLLSGTGQLVSGDLDTGQGAILSLNRRLVVLGPVVRLEGGLELTRFRSTGHLLQGPANLGSALRQNGAGLGLNAQFWVPFTGLAGELGLIQRVQAYRFEGANLAKEATLSRTWLRVGARWRLGIPGLHPYLSASYQEPLSRSHPVRVNSAADLASYFAVQGSGQEFERLWTFGAGLTF